ncbi:MAG: glycosyltransferase family 2 protein [Candidatus Peribacteraceae bacterium]|nr:glycosyltransferase family 2 protein [Candidatus Peribacteraceae bacterium]
MSNCSILVLNLNGLADTIECLDSVLASDAAGAEILVLDNGSANDEAAALRERYGDAIRVLRSEVNTGFPGGNNLLARETTREFILLLNNDTAVPAVWLTPLIAHLEANPDCAAAQPTLLSYADPSRFDMAGAAGGYIDALGYPYTRGRVFTHPELEAGLFTEPALIDWACGACALFRRETYLEHGGLDARFFSYMEEIDLCWRLKTAGHAIAHVPAARIRHKGGRTWKKMPFRRNYLVRRNSYYLLAANAPYGELLWKLPLRYAFEAASALHFCLQREWHTAAATAAAGFVSLFTLGPWLARSDRSSLGAGFVTVEFFLLGRKRFGDLSPATRRASSALGMTDEAGVLVGAPEARV